MKDIENLRGLIKNVQELAYMLDPEKADEIISYLRARLDYHEKRTLSILGKLRKDALDAAEEIGAINMMSILQAIEQQIDGVSTRKRQSGYRNSDRLPRESVFYGDTEFPQRRLPVYILLDNRGHDHIEKSQQLIHFLINELSSQPEAFEATWISTILLSYPPEVMDPLTELAKFEVHEIPKKNGSIAIDSTLRFLKERIEIEDNKRILSYKSDYKPIVFMFLSGTLDYLNVQEAKAVLINEQLAIKSLIVVTAESENSDNYQSLREIFDIVIPASRFSVDVLRGYFIWVSQSVAIQTQSLFLNEASVPRIDKQNDKLPPPPPGFEVVL